MCGLFIPPAGSCSMDCGQSTCLPTGSAFAYTALASSDGTKEDKAAYSSWAHEKKMST